MLTQQHTPSMKWLGLMPSKQICLELRLVATLSER